MIAGIYNNIQIDASGKVIASGNQDYALSQESGQISYLDIVVSTPITVLGASDGIINFAKINPTTTLSCDVNFDNGGSNNGTLRYIGLRTTNYIISATISYEPTITGDKYIFSFAKNSVLIDSSKIINDVALTGNKNSVSLSCIAELTTNDTIDIYVANLLNANGLTVFTFNLNIHG
jgi:hypothetical protein